MGCWFVELLARVTPMNSASFTRLAPPSPLFAEDAPPLIPRGRGEVRHVHRARRARRARRAHRAAASPSGRRRRSAQASGGSVAPGTDDPIRIEGTLQVTDGLPADRGGPRSSDGPSRSRFPSPPSRAGLSAVPTLDIATVLRPRAVDAGGNYRRRVQRRQL